MSRIVLTVIVGAVFINAAAVALGVEGEAHHVLDCSKPCSKSQCDVQKCDLDVPYACTAGKSAGGCSSSSSAFSNTTFCTACCYIASCSITCARHCTADECAHNVCSSTDSYLCTSGAQKGGCGLNSTWTNTPGCKSCCDTSTCPKNTSAPAAPSNSPAPTSAPLNCDHDCGSFCHSTDRCPFADEYMCTGGPSKGGCSNNSTQWSAPWCTSCCDVKKCPKITCGACSSSICNSTGCDSTYPYICTGGALQGGCSNNADYWATNPSCTSCCDYNDGC